MIEFIEQGHLYLVDGVITPSITTILKATIFADKYNGVSDDVLRRAAYFGTQVHKAIEIADNFHLDDEQGVVYQRYLELVKTHNIKPISHEIMVHYGYDYAGTLDMEAVIDDLDCLVDVKTTYTLDLEYLSWQLSLYEMARGKVYDKFYCIWLPKRKGAKLVEIPRKPKDELLKLIEVYYETCSK